MAGLLLAVTTAGCLQGGPQSAPPGTPGPSPIVSARPPGSAGPTPGESGGPSVAPTGSPPTSGTWARVEVDGPAPGAREDHTWTVAEDGRTAYLFGGRDGGTDFDDLWAFDLETEHWTRIDVAGNAPPARFGHDAAWIPGHGVAVWAGQAGSRFFDDLWLFDPVGVGWRRLPGGGDAPIARYGSCSGVGPDGRLWISHGFTADGVRFADTKAYDVGTGTWSDEAPSGAGPVERCLHACWWTADGQFALYGGQTTGVPALGDLWFLTPGGSGSSSNAWREASGQVAPARQLAAVARRGSLTVVFGGRGTDGKPLADTWVLPDGAAAFLPLATVDAPRARSGAAMVHDASRDRLVLFGGLGGAALDDVWELSLR